MAILSQEKFVIKKGQVIKNSGLILTAKPQDTEKREYYSCFISNNMVLW